MDLFDKILKCLFLSQKIKILKILSQREEGKEGRKEGRKSLCLSATFSAAG